MLERGLIADEPWRGRGVLVERPPAVLAEAERGLAGEIDDALDLVFVDRGERFFRGVSGETTVVGYTVSGLGRVSQCSLEGKVMSSLQLGFDCALGSHSTESLVAS